MKDDSFRDFVLDQLRGLPGVQCRAMFGGHGLRHEGSFFGLIFGGRFYLKTDTATRAEFIARGSGPFRPGPKHTMHGYYEVPAEVLEDDEVLARWAQRAAATPAAPAARAARAARAAKAKARPAARGTSSAAKPARNVRSGAGAKPARGGRRSGPQRGSGGRRGGKRK